MAEETLQTLFSDGVLTDARRLVWGPDDTLVVRGDMFAATEENVERIQSVLRREFPGRRVLVLLGGLDVGVLTHQP